jgi:Bacterial Ig-like domain (group 1)
LFNLPLNRLTSFVKILFIVSLLGGMAACGGGGAKAPSTGQPSTGGPGTIPGTDPGATSSADSIQLLVGSQTMPSVGGTAVQLTAVVLNSNGRALTEKAVTLAVVDPATNGKAFLTSVPDKTDDNGLLIGNLNLGTNKANRTITIRATSDSATATNTVDVVGTAVTISGATSLVSNATTPITVSLKDSGGNPLQGETVTLTSSQGNALSSTAPVTNRSGQVVVDVTGTRAGTDTITATALGASSTTSIVVSGSDFSFVSPSPPSNTDVAVNTDQQIKIRWREGNIPQNGLAVALSATRGTVTVTSVGGMTDAAGELTATIRSTSAGPTTVQASAPGGSPSTSLNFIFVTTSATAVNVQADRTTIPINTAGSDTNRATITAIVRDGASNLVKNARVQFQIVNDTTGGRLSGTEDITDVSGTATVDYIAGTTSSQNEGVLIKAIVIDVGGIIGAVTPANLSASVPLTVAGQSLFIRLSTDNKVTPASPNFTKLFSALVTDAAGNPVPNTRVQFELKPAQPPLRAYSKGAYFATASEWVKGYEALCFNEDLNLNGVLDALVSEDTNYNGILDPSEDQPPFNKIIDGRAPYGVEIGNIGGAPLPSEDIAQANGILDTGEDQPRLNGILDPGEDLDSDGILDPGEDQLRLNGILDPGEDLPSIPPNGVLDANEDVFRNGILDPAERLHLDLIVDVNEDFNRDGSLTPGNVATTTSNINTDALGFATTTVAYTQNFATWATVTLTGKITVAGSETTSSVSFTLPGLASDYTTVTVPPPGRVSPFGQRRNCKSRF